MRRSIDIHSPFRFTFKPVLFVAAQAALLSPVPAGAQSAQPEAPVEFRVGSLALAGGAHLTTLDFTVVDDDAMDLVVTGVTGPNANPVPSGGAFPLDLVGMSAVTVRLHQAPQAGQYTATLSAGQRQYTLVVDVPELVALEVPTVTRLEVDADSVEAEWQPVPGALTYRMTALGSRGQQPHSAVVALPAARLEGLAPGTYELIIEAYDYDAGAAMDANRPDLPRESTSSTTFHLR